MNDDITEDYVSYDLAKQLREKGFNEKCHASFNVNHEEYMVLPHGIRNTGDIYHDHLPKSWVSLPTYQMVIKWLRKKHDLIILMNYAFSDDVEDFHSTPKWEYRIVATSSEMISYSKMYDEPETAIEDAIKCALLLID